MLAFLFLPGPAIFSDPFAAVVLGLLVAAAGQGVRATTIGFNYIVRGGRGHQVYAEDLVTEGLFRHTRNPMYVGKFFMVLGAGLATNRWPAALAITACYAFMYHAIVLAEEDYLRRKFGTAFEDYCRRVPRWIPRWQGLGETLSRPFRWRRVVAKEYSAPLGWMAPIVGVGLYNLSIDPGREPVATVFLVALLCAGIALWSFAGFLKRTHSPLLRAE